MGRSSVACPGQARKKISAQMSGEMQRKLADYVIENDGHSCG